MSVFLVAGETRRIEDDQVVFRFRVFEEIEDIVFEHFDFHAVEFGVVARGIAGAGGDIDGGDLGRAGLGAGKGESALVGETIEHAFALGELGDLGVGLELVEVEAGFLAVVEVDFEVQIVGADHERPRIFAVSISIPGSMPSALRKGESFRRTMDFGASRLTSASRMSSFRRSIASVSVCTERWSP
jgi:hypothetical protein